jgi:hypothetical protein
MSDAGSDADDEASSRPDTPDTDKTGTNIES